VAQKNAQHGYYSMISIHHAISRVPNSMFR